MSSEYTKTSQLPIANTVSANDRILILSNPDTSPVTNSVQVQTIVNYVITPYSANTSTVSGQLQYDENYLYVTVANNTVKKVALT